GLDELKEMLDKTTKECSENMGRNTINSDEASQNSEEHHDNDLLEDIQRDVSEISQMVEQNVMLEDNHQTIISLTYETFQSLGEEQQMRHADVLRAIQERRRTR
ncbi:hypothetical protein BDZ97DRAFT_1804932, partial [Flammula alnicola]